MHDRDTSQLGGEDIPSLTWENFGPYLGLKFNPKGSPTPNFSKLNTWCERIQQAALKPHQKVTALRQKVIGKILHQARLCNTGSTLLKKLDRKIKHWFKRYLHLPEWTPDSWIHNKNGGALPSLEEMIPRAKMKAIQKMAQSEDVISSFVGLLKMDEDWKALEKQGFERHQSIAVIKKTT
jgi:hypothetical protein